MTAPQDQSLGELVSTATRDLSTLIRTEVQLAKVEIKQEVKAAGTGAGLFGGAGFAGLLALLFLNIAAAYGIAGLFDISVGWGFLIVGLLYLVAAAVLALIGKKKISQVGAPEKTVATVKDDIAWAKNPRSRRPARADACPSHHRAAAGGCGTLGRMPVDPSVVLVEGPWTHREVTGERHPVPPGRGRPAGRSAGRPAARLPRVLVVPGVTSWWPSARRASGPFAPDLRGYGGVGQAAPRLRRLHAVVDVGGDGPALGARDRRCRRAHGLGRLLAGPAATLHPALVGAWP
jgi:hypothetical protein